jgi:hypothetical protein
MMTIRVVLQTLIVTENPHCGMWQSLQAAVTAATATVLRNHVASPAVLADIAMNLPGRDRQQVVTECVHALCQWRDDVARDKDEG